MSNLLLEQKKSVWWWRDVIRAFQSNRANIRKLGIGVVVKKPTVGSMYGFYYDAKTKDTLPHWDIFPIMIPIEYYADGWLGINLHSVPPFQRKIGCGQLLSLRSDKVLNKNSSLR